MLRVALVLLLFLHGHLSSSAVSSSNAGDEDATEASVCNHVDNQGTRETHSSLLQMARKTHQEPSVTARTEKSTELLAENSTEQLRKTVLQMNVGDIFLYDHFPKAGGSFVRSILKDGRVIPKEFVQIRHEGEHISDHDRKTAFTVGSVRNPCDYYVSWWAYGGTVPAVVEAHGGPGYYGISEQLDTPEDKRRFAKWLELLMPDHMKPGLETSRLVYSYANTNVSHIKHPGPTMTHFSWQDRQRYQYAALNFNRDATDCWIHTETLTEDLTACLKRFEISTGQQIVNWTMYNALLEQRKKEHAVWTRKNAGQRKFVWTKKGTHQPCSFYYDEASADRVIKADWTIFSKFGYQSCCA